MHNDCIEYVIETLLSFHKEIKINLVRVSKV